MANEFVVKNGAITPNLKLTGSTSGTITVLATATAGTNTLTLPAVTGTAITTGDTGSVTNTMLAGSIALAKLASSTISGVSLGSNLNTLTISSPLTGTSYNGSAAVSIGMPAATTSVAGYLTAVDWTTFNGKQNALGFTPIQQGGGTSQSTNKLYIGWASNKLRLQVDSTDFGSNWPIDVSGFAAYATNQSGGTVSATTGVYSGLIVGATATVADINVANDAGSMSIRGNPSFPASVSFHRTGAYAINVGLSTANNFVIGGWSASANAFSMTGGGALTMLNNITAYSDERLKKNWRDLPVNFVERLAGVKHGIYDRTDQECTQVGVSAQSLQPLMPDAIMTQVDGMLSVSYGNAALVSAVQLAKEVVLLKEQSSMQSNTIELLIEAIKEQQVQIDELKELINKGK